MSSPLDEETYHPLATDKNLTDVHSVPLWISPLGGEEETIISRSPTPIMKLPAKDLDESQSSSQRTSTETLPFLDALPDDRTKVSLEKVWEVVEPSSPKEPLQKEKSNQNDERDVISPRWSPKNLLASFKKNSTPIVSPFDPFDDLLVVPTHPPPSPKPKSDIVVPLRAKPKNLTPLFEETNIAIVPAEKDPLQFPPSPIEVHKHPTSPSVLHLRETFHLPSISDIILEKMEMELAPRLARLDRRTKHIQDMFREMDTPLWGLSIVATSYLLGMLQISFVLVFILVVILASLLMKRESRHRRSIANLPPVSFSPQESTKPETCAFLNGMMKELWPHMSATVGDAIHTKMKSLLEQSMNQEKPTVVESINICEIKLEKVPPVFKNIIGTKPPHRDCRFDTWLEYAGPATILVDVALGGKIVNVKVPILIQDVRVRGKMRIELSLMPNSPYVHTLSYSFVELPEISLSIKPLKLLDIMDLPLIQQFMLQSIQELVRTSMVLPQQVSVPHWVIFGTEPEEISEESPFTPDPQGPCGILTVRIVDAKRLLSTFMGNSLPYCTLQFGNQEIKTKAVKKNRNPVWNELFEVTILENERMRNAERKMEVAVMSYTASDGHEFLGGASIDVSVGSTVQDITVPLERQGKSGVTVPAGTVHLQLKYVLKDKIS
eukprot:TRINITY_DN4781_c0_g1_i1.p1 TRINITY_DN4781_c0_g1~~TRINITY_DN4781_c0_g1_i1.p1  ORF type:complete len:664 (-),score=154.20 TRINITY_DN4781_c0_g1_i1:7-1998(-)